MSHKDTLLKQLDGGFNAFKELYVGLNDVQMTQTWLGDWCLRDILAHVAGWHWEMSGALERIARGERPTPEGVDYSNTDEWNKHFVAEKGALAPAQMVADVDQSFAAFRAAADTVPEDRFEPGRTVDRLLHANGIDHYMEHGGQIKEWRESL